MDWRKLGKRDTHSKRMVARHWMSFNLEFHILFHHLSVFIELIARVNEDDKALVSLFIAPSLRVFSRDEAAEFDAF